MALAAQLQSINCIDVGLGVAGNSAALRGAWAARLAAIAAVIRLVPAKFMLIVAGAAGVVLLDLPHKAGVIILHAGPGSAAGFATALLPG